MLSSRPSRLSPLMVICVINMAFVLANTQPSKSILRHVSLVFRHGERSPQAIFPNDVNGMNKWPDGLGWLSNLGKQRQYELGQYLRQRYGGFINVTRYDHRQISIQSSAVDRCVMSALSNLAGLFPAQGDQVWNDVMFPWQPIPILMTPMDQDKKIALTAKCPRYDQLYKDMVESATTKEYVRKNRAFLEMLRRKSGWKELPIQEMWRLHDPVACEISHNMTLNQWLQEEDVLTRLNEANDFSWELLYNSHEMAKLKGGPLLNEIINNMKATSNGSSGDLKVHMYSGHDFTVSALLHALDMSNGMQPPCGSLIMMELHTIDAQDVVKVFYRNDTSTDPFYLLPKGCEDPCRLSTFQSLMAPRIPSDWDEECKIVDHRPTL